MIGKTPFLSVLTCAALPVAAGAVLLGAAHVQAQSTNRNIGEDLAQDQSALIAAREQSERARQRSIALRQQADAADNEADRIAGEAAAVAARIQEAEADIVAARARIAIVEGLQKQQRRRLAEQQGPLVRLTAALQIMTRRPAALTLVEENSLDDLIYIRSILSNVIPEVEKRTVGLRKEIKRGRQLRQQADRAAASLTEGRQRLKAKRQELTQLANNQRVEASRFANDAGIERDRALALGEDARDILDLIGRVEASSEVRQSLASLDGPILRSEGQPDKAEQPARQRSADLANVYRLPVIGRVVTGLGEISPSGFRSRGLTLATEPQAQIVAPANGKVAYAGAYRGYGNIVIIEHDAGWTSLVTNLSQISVTVGETVRQGFPLGRAEQEEPQVTVELRRNGRPIDIAALIG